MNTAVRNRLVGGSVLAVCAVIFLPSLLTPENTTINQPSLMITQKGEDSSDKTGKANPESRVGIELSSVAEDSSRHLESGDKVAAIDAGNGQKSLNIPVMLESVGEITENKIEQTPQAKKDGKWIQVASFSNLKSADSLAKNLKDKKYPVKTELVEVAGTTYKRVVVGPISNNQVDMMVKQINEIGYKPKVQ